MKKVVLITHCIDTEGPLYESLEAKFNRLQDLFGINHIPQTQENFEKIQNAEINLNGLEQKIANVFNSHLANYFDTWDKIDDMLKKIMSSAFRNKTLDSFGGGWVYNWHCVDHVGYEYNPRRRDIGYHNIFDHYKTILNSQDNCRDCIHWHFHPMSIYKDAHICASSYVNSPELYQILCRKIIERNYFPTVFRAGFHVERPDSNLFLEQWIPFDISNTSCGSDGTDDDETIDFKKGRTGDWRLAPSDWSIYHPSHDNYQIPGNCRRLIARVLNVLNRRASINQEEMDNAFQRANSGLPTLVGITGHDFRNLEHEVEFVRNLIAVSNRKYPDVKFKFCEAVEAFREAVYPDGILENPLDLEVKFHPESKEDRAHIEVIAKSGKVFGPQPFLAIQTRSRQFLHDNFDFSITKNKWYYTFYSNTLPIENVLKIGIAANDKYGNISIKSISFIQ